MLSFHAPKDIPMLHRAHRWAVRRHVDREVWEASASRTIARAGGTPPATWTCRPEHAAPRASRPSPQPRHHLPVGR